MAGAAGGGASGGQQQSQQIPNGAYFRVPKYSAQQRFVKDSNNQSVGVTLATVSPVTAATTTLDRLDIVRALQVEIDIAQTYTAGGATFTVGPWYPYDVVGNLQLQFESAYNTFRLPGFLAGIMQQYRPAFGEMNALAMLGNSGANVQSAGQPSAGYQQANLLVGTGLTQASTAMTLIYEIPVSMQFDRYYELDLQGNPVAPCIQRAIVSPQYMAATTRSVTPTIQFNSMLLPTGTGNAFNSPVTWTAGAPTFSGTATVKVRRDGWFPASTVSTPPVYGWQYARDWFSYPLSGQTQVTIPLDVSTVGQGQILSVVIVCWDPSLNAGNGGVIIPGNMGELDILFGSNLLLYQDTPQSLAYRWLLQHGMLPPQGVLGWDFALTNDGLITNEMALNTLVTAGVQARLNFNSAPGASAVAYIGMEMLKAVSS